MDYAAQRRLITQSRSKMTKVNIMEVMEKPAAWCSLSRETRERLYSLLPPPKSGEPPYDVDEHPLHGRLREWVEAALLQWQSDLGEGRETKKFREHKIETTGEDMPLEDSDEGSEHGEASSR